MATATSPTQGIVRILITNFKPKTESVSFRICNEHADAVGVDYSLIVCRLHYGALTTSTIPGLHIESCREQYSRLPGHQTRQPLARGRVQPGHG